MRIASPVRFAQRHPVIVSVEFAAIAATFWWWSGGDVSVLTMDGHAWHGEFWRLFSSCLPHVDPIHLLFNLYWLTVFGSRVETTFGSLTTSFWLLVFEGGSSVADYDLAEGGVGLSGMVYGLFAFVWILSKYDSRFHDAMPPQVAPLFVAWFFLCIGLTYADVWRVANVAHGAGAAFGVLAGLVMSPPQGHRREAAAAALLAMLIVTLAAGIFARPYVNFTNAAGWELAEQAYDALERKENQRAVELLERAVRSRHTPGDWWHNLGIAYD